MSATYAEIAFLLNLTSIVMDNLGNTTTVTQNVTSNPLTEMKPKNVTLVVVIVLLFVASIVGVVYYVTSSAFNFTKTLRESKLERYSSQYDQEQKACCQYVPMVQSDDSDVLYEADPRLY